MIGEVEKDVVSRTRIENFTSIDCSRVTLKNSKEVSWRVLSTKIVDNTSFVHVNTRSLTSGSVE